MLWATLPQSTFASTLAAFSIHHFFRPLQMAAKVIKKDKKEKKVKDDKKAAKEAKKVLTTLDLALFAQPRA